MKKLFTAIMIIVALAWTGATRTLAQDSGGPTAPPAPPEPPTPVVILHDAQKIAEDAVHKAQDDVEKHMGEVQQNMKSLGDHLRIIGRRIMRGGKPLVVRSSDMAPGEQGNLEEDLTVMTHILDKTLAEKFPDDESGRVAMGISVSFVPGEAPMRSLYLDGYGALFFVRVNFPLLAPPLEKNVESQKAPVDSTWQEAREEVYGQPAPGAVDSFPAYDAAKVSALQGVLLDALKDASNIRNVKPDESITVCVIGAPAEAPKHTRAVASASGGGGSFGHSVSVSDYEQATKNFDQFMADFPTGGRDDAAGDKTTLTIRVKKADCEAFAKGKLTVDEFRSRAVIKIYRAPATAS
jgi:hypothetical protein